MAIHLTQMADVPASLAGLDQQRPDGTAKEIVARAAALHLLTGSGDLLALLHVHDLIAPLIAETAAAGANVTNAIVKALLAAGALHAGAGQTTSDAAVTLAAAVSDVMKHNAQTFAGLDTEASQHDLATSAPTWESPRDSGALDDLDLLAPEFEPLRFVLTRTLSVVRPEVYAQYRQIKDCGSASSREDAYAFAFGVLATLIDRRSGH